ncbi:MAG: penicillin-binding protein, partial [Actinobacteria bacterium]|nr:penicillin-binding protein [Actinomycetota bacterium]
ASYLNVAYFDHSAYGIEVASEVYFSEHASQLTLPQAALLAGIVQYPTLYDPVANPGPAKDRRDTVLNRMWDLNYISRAAYLAAVKTPIVLHRSNAPLATGCTSPQAARAAYFCDYVEHVMQLDYPSIWKQVNNSGGLAIYTTMNLQDQLAAYHAVTSVEPAYNYTANPGNNADAEVLIQPGTGAIRAIAVNRPYGSGTNQNSIDYAVNSQYGGSTAGVQTGSSSKIFTLITALEQGFPFGHQITIKAPETIGPFFSCQGLTVPAAQYSNAEGKFSGTETFQLGEATVESVNTYFVNLEKQVGLCNVVKTAVAMGMTRADGRSLLAPDGKLGTPGYQSPADSVSSFTLGSVSVSPMSMAAAYATVASGGVYCHPRAIAKIVVMSSGKQLQVQPATCHQAIPSGVAAAANFILQRVLQSPGTAAGRNTTGHFAAAKTGTADKGFYAAFAGWTPTLAGYVSVFNPRNPTGSGAMLGANSQYVDLFGEAFPGQMFGDNAPGATWQETFNRADLGPNVPFPAPPSSYFSQGDGFGAPTVCNQPNAGPGPTPNPGASGCPSGGGGRRGGSPPPTPLPTIIPLPPVPLPPGPVPTIGP